VEADAADAVTAQVPAPSAERPSMAVTRRTPTPAAGGARKSGWLTSSDSIAHRFPPGTILDGRYRLIGLLGRGGMGEVYRADDLRLGQPVALKFLPEALGRDAVRLAQFHNEVRTARQVSHPNVCRVYDVGDVDGLLYLSMEYVDGEDLATSLRRIGRFPEDKATDIARQLCAGLAAAHQRGVLHRDLKPANVMLDGAGHVRVMDFGLAAAGAVEDIRSGTPAYMAPEQLLGREVTVRSDIFALGLVLYELFTGRRAFTAATVGDLVSQHDSRSLTPPSSITPLDPAVERAILRCLEPDPDRRPASALAVSAALPGGDPLAAALAAGETPSPEMVAAAGQGAGLEPRVAWAVLLAVIAGVAASFAISIRTSPLDRMQLEFPAEVLAQKARDAIQRIGYPDRPRDAAYGFSWDERLAEQLQAGGAGAGTPPAPAGRPSPLYFWYRQSREPLMAITFHTDLLTPGLVRTDDPPPTTSGMIEVALDHTGLLTFFEAIPPQRQEDPAPPSPVEWSPLFSLAGVDVAQLQPADPLWNFLAASDTRAAWTGAWPGTGRPMRVEAAALGGRPTAFMLVDPSTSPSRMPEPPEEGVPAEAFVLLALALSILFGAGVLARKNLRDGRGDRGGASRLAVCVVAVLLALWACQVHLVASPVFFAIFMLAVCTSVFYGVLHWMLYMALEPFVRRHWPQVLVSLTNVLSGRAGDPVVGRDVLYGAALGVAWAVMLRALDAWTIRDALVVFPGAPELLLGVRSALGVVLEEAPYAIRNSFLYFFLLVVLRVVLRRQWIAAAAFAALFGVLSALGEERPVLEGLIGFLYFGMGAAAILRWGLLTLAVASFVLALLMDVPATLDTSVWYFGNMILLVGIVITLAAWAAYTSTAGRLMRADAFG
jgi:serine/threonine-protein kinase